MALRNPILRPDVGGNRLQTAPLVEPVTLTELKTALRITDDEDDLFLAELIQDATREIEDYSGLAMITQEWKLSIDRWPGAQERWWDGTVEGHIDTIYTGGPYGSVVLPRYPLLTVDAVTVYDEASNAAAVTIADVFDIDVQSLRGRMTRKRGATWPIALRANNAIEIEYTAGYGAAASAVPAPLKRAVRGLAAYLYTHRGDGCDPGDALARSGAAGVLDRYRDVRA